MGTNIFVRQMNIHSFENQMNVIINILICTYKWGSIIDLRGAPASMLNFYNSYYATRNLVDNPINKNTRIQSKTNDSTSQMENPKSLGIMFLVNVPIPFQVFIQNYVSRCIQVFRHCIGCSKSFSLKSQSIYSSYP